jgi:AraC-like DNA-binding protein
MYEAWNLKIPDIPPRSRLYPLEPIGKGTPLVEGLTSYILRLADAHAVPVGALVSHELAHLRPPSRSGEPWKARWGRRTYAVQLVSYAVNGLEDGASRWVGALEAGTLRNDLSQLTLLSFREFLCSLHLFRKVRAWCPSCLEEWQMAGSTIYEPLLWSLKLVKVCPKHHRHLAERCPLCCRAMKPLASDSRPGRCSHCYRWVGALEGKPFTQNAPIDWAKSLETRRAKYLGDLLAYAPRLDGRLLRQNFRHNLRRCVHELFRDNKAAFAHFVNCPSGAVENWVSGVTIPRINRFLEACVRLEVPMVTFLKNSSQDGTIDWRSLASRIDHDRPVGRYWRREETLRALEPVLRERPAPTLAQVAQRLRYKGTEGLRRVAPEICKQITRNYQNSFTPAPFHKGPRPRICEAAKIEAALRQSLAQRTPEPVPKIAVRLGYAQAAPILVEFPALCRAINAKLADRKQDRLKAMRRTIIKALAENPPPTLRALAHRLGYRDKKIIGRYFPDLQAALIDRRETHKLRKFRQLTLKLQSILRRQPLPSALTVARSLGLSVSTLQRRFPEPYQKIVARNLPTGDNLAILPEFPRPGSRRLPKRRTTIFSDHQSPTRDRGRSADPGTLFQKRNNSCSAPARLEP